jgi:SAM-dependent methyltransferase
MIGDSHRTSKDNPVLKFNDGRLDPDQLSEMGLLRGRPPANTMHHLKLAADWLLLAQKATRTGGYSRYYSLFRGWGGPYPETTGYIIPTMLDTSKSLNDTRYEESALRAGEWLLSKQKPDGSWGDPDGNRSMVFDTGQILLGIVRLYEHTGIGRYRDAAVRAAKWICSVQEPDGCWKQHAYCDRPHTYYTRVSAALLQAGRIADRPDFAEAAHRQLAWTISNQHEDGYFAHMGFNDKSPPWLHTIIYVLEGLFASWENSGREEYLNAVLTTARRLLQLEQQQIMLAARYRPRWEAVGTDRCITGIAQWAGCALRLHAVTGDRQYLDSAVGNLYYLKSKQIRIPGALCGALPGSIPAWGSYGPWKMLNWNNKFFIDALNRYLPLQRPMHNEQAVWSARCFRAAPESMVGASLSEIDRLFAELVIKTLPESRARGNVLIDIGCGKGKYVSHFRKSISGIRVVGIDPCFRSSDLRILPGNVYDIPVRSAAAHAVIAFDVLQHIGFLDRALNEIMRILAPGGLLFIAEKSKLCLRGLAKPLLELTGTWMYPWDSPFRERWYSAAQWRTYLSCFGEIQTMRFHFAPSNPPLKDRYIFLVVRKR